MRVFVCVTIPSHEYAFPLTVLFGWSAHVTFGGSGSIMSTVRLELPYQCIFQAKNRVETFWRGTQCSDEERNAAMWMRGYNMLV